LRFGVNSCLQGLFAGLVTAPLHKGCCLWRAICV
jgi:4-hydroxy-L-threonine phosphate dehydrogenase PdxA